MSDRGSRSLDLHATFLPCSLFPSLVFFCFLLLVSSCLVSCMQRVLPSPLSLLYSNTHVSLSPPFFVSVSFKFSVSIFFCCNVMSSCWVLPPPRSRVLLSLVAFYVCGYPPLPLRTHTHPSVHRLPSLLVFSRCGFFFVRLNPVLFQFNGRVTNERRIR